MSKKKVLLTILDGWGLGPNPADSAIVQGNTSFIDSLMKNYPNATLRTDGMHVGLPEGQMGNSEVGHMNIGAGRVVYQDLVKINLDIENGDLEKKSTILEGIDYARENKVPVHLMGLVSDGGVHSHINHLVALCKIFSDQGIPVFVHAFMDGRDTDPKSGKGFLEILNNKIEKLENAQLASVIGRYFAMDRDKRWDRVKKAYDLLVRGVGKKSNNISETLQSDYDNGLTDEFLEPIIMSGSDGKALASIKDKDLVFFFNFRSDRPRELTTVLSQEDMPQYDMKALNLHFLTMTPYDEAFSNVHVVYDKDNLKETLGEVLSDHGKSQLRIAETEKYAHVTFFFSGGREEEFKNEHRILVPSPKVATYDLMPEMSAFKVTEEVLSFIESKEPDFICLNYANSDMVGHTGVFEAALKAVEAVDNCVETLVEKALKKDYDIIIIADHGNSDVMRNEDGSVNTAHSLSPVPIIYVSNETNNISISDGKLADIAPSILNLMKIEAPKLMAGKCLISRNL